SSFHRERWNTGWIDSQPTSPPRASCAAPPLRHCGRTGVRSSGCGGERPAGSAMARRRRTPQMIHAEGQRRVGHALRPAVAMLGAGVVGYHYLVDLPWIDALLNASMILGGMGPTDPIRNDIGKLFASVYALLSGLVFVAMCGVLIAPFAHRFLHRFHAELEDE